MTTARHALPCDRDAAIDALAEAFSTDPVFYALGHTAWNAVANLAVIMNVPSRDAGRASGVIILGFLMGLTIAGPATGAIVDVAGRYEVVWWLSVALAAASACVLAVRPPEHREQ